MMQTEKTYKKPTCITLPYSTVYYAEDVLSSNYTLQIFCILQQQLEWEIKPVIIFGKQCKENRLTCSYSFTDKSTNYRFAGCDHKASLAPLILVEIKDYIEHWCMTVDPSIKKLFQDMTSPFFNYVYLNFYKDGSHNIGMHSDDETSLLGPIVCVSLGSERFFDFKPRKQIQHLTKGIRIRIQNGSILIMSGQTQKFYKHGIPVQKKIKKPRISLTFRSLRIDPPTNFGTINY